MHCQSEFGLETFDPVWRCGQVLWKDCIAWIHTGTVSGPTNPKWCLGFDNYNQITVHVVLTGTMKKYLSVWGRDSRLICDRSCDCIDWVFRLNLIISYPVSPEPNWVSLSSLYSPVSL